ncbi:MAG: efflux RND transporter periplasmic adaptor subunit [Planctomycetota bacterium]|nr:MAG: efflux RND transporter periplasmic adaptor subunit [Planctomycetota bacterium]
MAAATPPESRTPGPGAIHAPGGAWRGVWGTLRGGLGGVAMLAAGAAAWWWLATHHFSGGEHPEVPLREAAAAEEARGLADEVTLPEASRVAAGIELGTVTRQQIRDRLTVPGRIDYDARRRLDYASPVDGIISKVLVQVRQRVSKGDSLAEISSPDVGKARDEVRRREDDRAIEMKAAEWSTTVADNVESLLDILSRRPGLALVEEQFKDRVLGSYRENLLGSYSKLLFVEKVNASTRSLGEGGVLSGRIIEERTSNLEVARANFDTACEQSRFMTRQDRDRARASLAQADRLVQVSREYLRTLVGSRLGAEAAAVADDGADSPGDTNSLSALVLRTPFDGLVEDVFVARGERVQAGDQMFVVADTSTLWVRAQIHEREWTAVEVAEGQEVRVVVPGAERHETTARVHHVGATVEAESRSVPLVAELTNDINETHIKPGMFVWVDLPQGTLREAIVVPIGAVMRHEGLAFVFVPLSGGRYRRANIKTGIESGGLVEVLDGLQEGEQVVLQGAFVLKSVLLQNQE